MTRRVNRRELIIGLAEIVGGLALIALGLGTIVFVIVVGGGRW